MTTAIILYPGFSECELSAVISVLTQANHPKVFIGLDDEPVIGEAGLSCNPDISLNEAEISQYQSLILPGVDDFKHLLAEDDLFSFIRSGYKQDAVIAAISSAPYLMAKSGILDDRSYTAGISKQSREFLGVFNEERYVDAPYVFDRGILTAKGNAFVDFAIKFGQVLELDFNPGWYR
ncbi:MULTISPECIES: DJ-1/PfpI family protein [Bacillaceae]|uniref:DJ-1/PfpI family protein n=1 Tax=Bacillaceae TaxID=186817 RepID=UPI0029650B23|nr:DJ-1/PfpI family protein [Bacillus infantis]MDW2878085.1 DJ-1/PfpI family protein [Bacillus infantis]